MPDSLTSLSVHASDAVLGTQRRSTRRHHSRKGISTIEVIVSFTLLSTVLSAAIPLVVRHGRLLSEQRSYRLALDELSNELDRLTALPVDEVKQELEHLEPSELTAKHLPDAALSGQLEENEIGHRIELQITWQSRPPQAPPLSLVGWVIPPAPDRGLSSSTERDP